MNKEYEYFKDCKGIEQAKRLWKCLAMVNHPDHGGDNAVMQEINKQYLEFLKTNGLDTEKQAERDSSDFKSMGFEPEIIMELINNVMGNSPYIFIINKVFNVVSPFIPGTKTNWNNKDKDEKLQFIDDSVVSLGNIIKALVK